MEGKNETGTEKLTNNKHILSSIRKTLPRQAINPEAAYSLGTVSTLTHTDSLNFGSVSFDLNPV